MSYDELTEKEIEFLRQKSIQIRKSVIEILGDLGFGHIGGSMSIIETLVILYYKLMNVTPDNYKDRNRNRLVLSKGHAGPSLYCILSDLKFFPKDWLFTVNRGGTRLPSHCDMNLTPGIDMTTGSLGHGLSIGVGIALANKMDGIKKNTYVVIGDGESNEGQIWEAAMAAKHYKLSDLIVFTDYNKLCLDGYLHDIMDISDITSKWNAFGWNVQRIYGHNLRELYFAITQAKKENSRPNMIVLDTIKGKDCSFAENTVQSHHMKFDKKMADDAISILEKKSIFG